MNKLSEVLIDLAAIKTLTYKPPRKREEHYQPIVEPINKEYKIVDIFNSNVRR